VRVSVSRRCTAPPEQVWPWVSDPHLHVRTLPSSVSDVEVQENGDIACVLSAMGTREAMVVRVVERDPPRRLVERRVDGGREVETVFELRPDGDGTEVALSSEIGVPRLLGGAIRGPVERGLTEQLALLDRLSATEQAG
jgi:carbon monoxide dehydrogenase subunit G